MDAAEDRLVEAAADLAAMAQAGTAVPHSVAACLRAEALTRAETVRHRLEREARERAARVAGELGEVALQLLRVAIFAL